MLAAVACAVAVAAWMAAPARALPDNFARQSILSQLDGTVTALGFVSERVLLVGLQDGRIVRTDPHAGPPVADVFMTIANLDAEGEKGK